MSNRRSRCLTCGDFITIGQERASFGRIFCSFACSEDWRKANPEEIRKFDRANEIRVDEAVAALAAERAQRDGIVAAASMFGVLDTYQTEAERNGHKPAQGRML